MEIHGRNAVVTGGAVRVGRAIAIALAGAGANVFIHYNRSSGPAEKTAAECRELGVRAEIGSADLSDPRNAPSIVAQATEALGPASILVNSASAFPEDTLGDVTYDDWHQTHDLTLASPVFLTQAFAGALGEEDGAVVNVTDVRTERPYVKHLSYMVAKGGLEAFTRAAALTLAPRIRVNAVALGVILPPPGEQDSYAERLAARLPLPRAGGTEPVAETVLFLLRNDFVTGEIVRVDGGGHLV
jgi:NAD(P)-dependent dehydrogenase (short-subunit alcohol dehydrogenase family)